jgi:hypothetical protein
MALTQNFSTTQTLGAPSLINFEDTSSGSDATITTRRIWLIKADGTYLEDVDAGTEYWLWDYDDDTIIIDTLDKDYCLNVLVQWLNGSNTVVYSKAVVTLFVEYILDFIYELTQRQSSNPQLVNDNQYYANKSKVIVEWDSAVNAVELASDQYGAQNCLDRAANLMNNQPSYFGTNQ